MRSFLLGLLLFFSLINIHAQEIKKIKVDELDAYIQNCDHPLIINFWATYCQPCTKEIPYLQKSVEQQQDKKVELILVSVDTRKDYPEKLMSFVKDKNITATVFWLNEGNPDYFCPKIDKKWIGGIPATLFVNNKTHYRKFFDRQLTEPQVVEGIHAMLKEGL
jgi:thiol-disulfide isomerase/thioredoxin